MRTKTVLIWELWLALVYRAALASTLDATEISAEDDDPIERFLETRALADNGMMEDGKTPCNLPRSEDPDFSVYCSTNYLEKRYVCDPDQTMSVTEINRIDTDILRKNQFYRYCFPCPSRERSNRRCHHLNSVAIGEVDESQARHRKSNGTDAQMSEGSALELKRQQEYYERYIRKKRNLPPVHIAVNIYAKLIHPHTLALVQKYLPCAENHLRKGSTDKVTDNLMVEAYGRISDERWRIGSCSPNLTILLFTGDTIEYMEDGSRKASYRGPRLHVTHRFSDQPNLSWLVSKMNEQVRDLNADNSSSTASDRLYKFLQQFSELYDEANHRPRHHAIPVWAAVTFGVCAVLSLCAVLVGNLITSADRRGNRKTKHSSKGHGKRKWRAGFSGGMWASV